MAAHLPTAKRRTDLAPAARPGLARLPWLLAVAFVLSRLPGLPAWPEDHDAVNLVLGLQKFDLAAHRPHFPGYPVLLALAWPWAQLGVPAPMALCLPAVLAGGLATAVLTGLVQRLAGPAVALAAAATYLLLPGPWLADGTALSDGLGMHLITLALVATLTGTPRSLQAAAVLCGLLLGVRASAWPIAAGLGLWLLVRAPDVRAKAGLLGLGLGSVLLWLVPLTALAGGPSALLDIGMRFTDGHLHQWGNTAVGTHAGIRPGSWLEGLGGWALGLPGGIALLVLGLRAGRPNSPRLVAGLLALAVVYALWLLAGQNPDKPRHVLPILPVLVLAAALLASRPDRPGWRWQGAMALALATLAVHAVPRLVEKIQAPSPEVQLGRWLARQDPAQLVVLGGSEVGVLRHVAPAVRSLRIAKPDDVLPAAGQGGGRPRRVLVTSLVPGVADLAGRKKLATFPPRPGVDRRGIEVFALGGPEPAVAEVRR